MIVQATETFDLNLFILFIRNDHYKFNTFYSIYDISYQLQYIIMYASVYLYINKNIFSM